MRWIAATGTLRPFAFSYFRCRHRSFRVFALFLFPTLNAKNRGGVAAQPSGGKRWRGVGKASFFFYPLPFHACVLCRLGNLLNRPIGFFYAIMPVVRDLVINLKDWSRCSCEGGVH